MKNLIYLLFIASIAFSACNDSSTPTPNDKEEETKEEGMSEMAKLTRAWRVKEAFHDGNHDGSSTGSSVEFFKGNSYNYNGSFDGTYEWASDSSLLYLDKGSSFAQDWTIVKLDEENFEVTFNSPFTGKPSRWVMVLK